MDVRPLFYDIMGLMKMQHLKTSVNGSARRGQVAVLTTLVIVFILALAGLSIDVGEFWNTRRQMQTAADAAARKFLAYPHVDRRHRRARDGPAPPRTCRTLTGRC